jgi:ABC-type transport system substrate-binding protein
MNLGTAFLDDPRMRRAASMVIDRDEMIRAVYSTSTWTDQGLDVPLFWDGHLSSAAASWIDPKTDELGAGAKWFQYNPEEAKALLDAAGYNNEQLDFIRRASFGPANLADVISEMLRAGGFNINDIAIEANAWRDMKFAGPTAYNGFFWHTANAFNDDGYLLVKYTETGRDRAIEKDVPGISDLILELRQEFDQERKAQMLKDVQIALADHMPDVPIVSTQPTLGFGLTWPWLRNTAWAVPGFNQSTSSARQYVDYFIDQDLKEQYG